MIKYYSFIIFCLCLISCSDKTETKDVISVDLEDITQPSIYDIFSDISVIPLETTTESLIKNISKVQYYKSRYYILDSRPFYRILVFDSAGKYLYKIDNRGNGPHEYIDISDFYINKHTDQIVTLSNVSTALNYYTIDGTFVKKARLDKFGIGYNSLQYINSDTIAFWTNFHDNRMKYYSTKEDKMVHEDFPEEHKDLFHPDEFLMDGFLSRGLTNTVYSLKNGKTEKAYTWDFGENNDLSNVNIPKGFDYKKIRRYAEDVYCSVSVNYVFKLQGQNDRYIYAKLVVNNKERNILYDKKKYSSIVFNKTKEDATIFPKIWTNDHIISTVEPGTTLEYILPSKIRTPEVSNLINNIKDEDNPVLIKHTFINK